MRAISLLGGAVETSCDRLWATCCRRCSRGMPPYTSLQGNKEKKPAAELPGDASQVLLFQADDVKHLPEAKQEWWMIACSSADASQILLHSGICCQKPPCKVPAWWQQIL